MASPLHFDVPGTEGQIYVMYASFQNWKKFGGEMVLQHIHALELTDVEQFVSASIELR